MENSVGLLLSNILCAILEYISKPFRKAISTIIGLQARTLQSARFVHRHSFWYCLSSIVKRTIYCTHQCTIDIYIDIYIINWLLWWEHLGSKITNQPTFQELPFHANSEWTKNLISIKKIIHCPWFMGEVSGKRTASLLRKFVKNIFFTFCSSWP